MYKIYHLKISSYTYIGGIGAEHFYGKIVFDNRAERYGFSEVELKHPLSEKEALYLNKKDQTRGIDFTRYKTGELSEKFWTEKEVEAAALRWMQQNEPKDILVKGERSYYEPKKIIYSPKEFNAKTKILNKLTSQYEAVEQDSKLSNKLYKKYFKIFDKYCIK